MLASLIDSSLFPEYTSTFKKKVKQLNAKEKKSADGPIR